MTFQVELEREADGRWIAEVTDLPGVLAYGATQDEAQAKVQALALRVMAERLEHGEAGPQLLDISFERRDQLAEHQGAEGARSAAAYRLDRKASIGFASHAFSGRLARLRYSPFMMATKSVRKCWPASPSELG